MILAAVDLLERNPSQAKSIFGLGWLGTFAVVQAT
jgi:hypothetical protein